MCPFHQESVPTTCCWPMAASGSISRASRGRIASSRANDRSKYARYIWRWSRPLSNNKEECGGGPCAGLRMMPTSKPQKLCSLKHLASSASRKAPLSRTSAWLSCSCPSALALQPGAIYGARTHKSWSCQDLANRGRLGATGCKVPQSLQPESPGRRSLDGPPGGLQLIILVALLASTRTFGVEPRTCIHSARCTPSIKATAWYSINQTVL